ncbi:hypothetical protein GIB67_018175 [Kingdonia uniflora]|uniref:Uncharacterized protein n=1 Tax=Kingdonia uniflora TaxID=39325 RepID=A0A7J7NMC3_9MAGN|nr:hypothetical protein GIB67_018175 [Kingdonia uniflora]
MVSTQEPIVSRLDRLDLTLKKLEDIKGSNRSPRSSFASTTQSSGTVTSDGGNSSVNSSPKNNLEKHCRPIDTMIMETEVKGNNLIDRLVHMEDRVLKLCMLVEEEREAKKKKRKEEHHEEKKAHMKGLRQLVKSCVRGKPKSKH